MPVRVEMSLVRQSLGSESHPSKVRLGLDSQASAVFLSVSGGRSTSTEHAQSRCVKAHLGEGFPLMSVCCHQMGLLHTLFGRELRPPQPVH